MLDDLLISSPAVQARLVFNLTATLGVRTIFFQYWRWAAVEVIKVPMRDGKPIQASEVREEDPEIKVGSAVMQRITYNVLWCCDDNHCCTP